MNILYIHRTQGKGVEGVHINGIVNALRRLGNNVDIISPLSGIKKSNTNKKIAKISKLLPEIFFEMMEMFYNIIAAKKIKNSLKSIKYNLIYERYAFFAWTGMIFAGHFDIPFLLEVNFTTYTPIIRKRSKVLLHFARYIEKKVFKKADAIFVVSSFLKNQLTDMGVSENRIYFTPNAVDEKVFSIDNDTSAIKDKYNLKEKIVIGYVGGFYYWHGLDLLLSAIKIIERKRNNLFLLLIGEGPEKERLKELYKEIELTSELNFPGMIEYEKLPYYIKAMDICVLPDFNDYGSPVKIFEYMAMGKPVVAPRLGPLEDVINDGENGLLFEQGNTDKLAGCIEKILSDSILYSKISNNAKSTIMRQHLWKHNVEKILKAYSNLKSHEE